jgi:hypothetical protein
MPIDLSECRAKIQRAQEHSDSLQAIVTPVVMGDEPDFVQLSAKLDPQSGYHVFRVAAIQEDQRLRVGIILGDIVQNLRSALDYLFWQLYCHYIRVPRTDGEAKGVQFPIEDGPERFGNKRVHFHKIPSPQWAVIDDAQPYNGADPSRDALRAIRELSNRDKHRALNPLLLQTYVVQFYDETLAARATTEFDFNEAARYLEVGAEVVRVGLPNEVDAEMEEAGHIAPDIQLPEMNTRMVFGVSVMMNRVQRIIDGIQLLL